MLIAAVVVLYAVKAYAVVYIVVLPLLTGNVSMSVVGASLLPSSFTLATCMRAVSSACRPPSVTGVGAGGEAGRVGRGGWPSASWCCRR